MRDTDFPTAYEDHWGYIHILKSPKAAKELFIGHMRDYVKDIDDAYLNELVFAAETSDDPDDWFRVIELFADNYADECWYRKEITIYE